MTEPVAERTFTEKEAYALVADNVQRETADAKATIESLQSEKASLQTQVDTLEAAKAAETARAEAAEKALEDYKEGQEREKAQEARKGERTAKVREVAKHLKDDFFTPERAARWAAMDDEAFTAYCEEIAAVAPAGPPVPEKTTPPREVAMTGTPVAGSEKGSLLGSFLRGPAANKAEV